MQKVERISVLELMAIILVNRFLFSFSFMPTVTISPANQDSWIADLLSGVFLFCLAIPLLIMSTRFPKLTFNQYFEVILGKPIGKFISLIYAFYLIFISVIVVLLLSDFMLSAVFPETPLYALVLFMLVPCCYGTFKGLECIGRASVVMEIFIVSIVIIYGILNYNNMDFKVFLPIMRDTSLKKLSFGAFNNASRFCDCFLFFSFIANTNQTKKWTVTRIFTITVIIFILINTMLTIFTQAVLGPDFAKIMKAPYYSSIQEISVFNIIQRIEFFNVIAWNFILFFKLSSGNLASAMILSQAFNTKSYKSFVIPMNIIIFIVVVFSGVSDYPLIKIIIRDVAYWVIFSANFVIPFMVLIVYFIRKKSLPKMSSIKAPLKP